MMSWGISFKSVTSSEVLLTTDITRVFVNLICHRRIRLTMWRHESLCLPLWCHKRTCLPAVSHKGLPSNDIIAWGCLPLQCGNLEVLTSMHGIVWQLSAFVTKYQFCFQRSEKTRLMEVLWMSLPVDYILASSSFVPLSTWLKDTYKGDSRLVAYVSNLSTFCVCVCVCQSDSGIVKHINICVHFRAAAVHTSNTATPYRSLWDTPPTLDGTTPQRDVVLEANSLKIVQDVNLTHGGSLVM